MSVRIADYSYGVPGAAALLNMNYAGVMRYASSGRPDVNITRSEYFDLLSHGLSVGIVDEHAASYMLGGFVSGGVSAETSRNIVRAAGIPDGVIYFAADWDATLGGAPVSTQAIGNMRAIQSFLEGARDRIGADNVGLYAGYYVVAWVATYMPWVKWFWQTEAWSGGNVHNRTNLLQRARQEYVNSVQVDINVTLTDNYGQRDFPANYPDPTKPPTNIPQQTAEVDITKMPVLQQGSNGVHVVILQFLLNAGAQLGFGKAVSTDGIFGPATTESVRIGQAQSGLVVDGIVGQSTYTKLLVI